MIIDFHTHCFPDHLAQRAMSSLSIMAKAAKLDKTTDGTADGLLQTMKDAGVNISVVCNIATNPKQQTNVNNFAIYLKQNNSNLIPLGSLNPDSTELELEIKRLSEAGILGIKIHPDYMKTKINDEKFGKVFKLCIKYNFFVVTHAGFDPSSPLKIHAKPKYIREVHDRYPELRLIAAHFGGYNSHKEVLQYLCGCDNVYIDLSLANELRMHPDVAISIINAHNPNLLLFGSDTPWGSVSKGIYYINNLSIDTTIKNKIFYENAKQLLQL